MQECQWGAVSLWGLHKDQGEGALEFCSQVVGGDALFSEPVEVYSAPEGSLSRLFRYEVPAL